MVTKIFLAMALIIGGGLILQARADSQKEARALKMETRDAASTFAQLIVGSVEHAMLEGEGIKVKRLIEDLKRRVRGTDETGAAVELQAADIRIYDQRGIEVFAPRSTTAPAAGSVPAHISQILAGKAARVPGRILQPVENQARCVSCHPPAQRGAPEKYRGVLELKVVERTCAERRQQVFAQMVTAGFSHMMTARQAKRLPTYFKELATAKAVRAVTVFNVSGEARYGEDINEVTEEVVKAVIATPRARTITTASGQVSLVPLVMEERCRECHSKPTDVLGRARGVLAVAIAPVPATSGCDAGELVKVVDTSLRFIMLSELGRRIADFLDAAVATGAISEIILYDSLGRTYWNTTHPEPPRHIAQVLHSAAGSFEFRGTGDGEMVRVVQPLLNKPGCKRCHDTASALRGAVSVSLSTAKAARTREASMRRRTKYTGLTLLGILIILGGFLQYFVVRPVNHIGDVADEVGKGNLSVSVRYAHPDGDEVARLGDRINEMVKGLRTKTQLEKFVSKGTVEAAADASGSGVERSGQLRRMAILFSDIRGFTAFSETVAPEQVVAMLNTLLQLQADAVVEHGGDIDKFVGDELMALFYGEDAAARAVRCGIHMVRAIREEGLHGLAVGVGISAGDVVYGAIGHENRMDFTVIGDVVNTGARLCSAAAPGEIIVTRQVYDECAGAEDIELEPGEPLALKGKRAPLENYRVPPTPT